MIPLLFVLSPCNCIVFFFFFFFFFVSFFFWFFFLVSFFFSFFFFCFFFCLFYFFSKFFVFFPPSINMLCTGVSWVLLLLFSGGILGVNLEHQYILHVQVQCLCMLKATGALMVSLSLHGSHSLLQSIASWGTAPERYVMLVAPQMIIALINLKKKRVSIETWEGHLYVSTYPTSWQKNYADKKKSCVHCCHRTVFDITSTKENFAVMSMSTTPADYFRLTLAGYRNEKKRCRRITAAIS